MSRPVALVVSAGLVAIATLACLRSSPASSQGGDRGADRPRGAVASGEPVATHVGIEILRQGGDAVDAAVGVALALAVVHPQAGNLGGGGFAVVRTGDTVASIDFRETAPAAATATMFLDAEGKPVEDASIAGPLAAGVPGSPRGLYELHRRFGRLPWGAIVSPALALARDGFVVTPRLQEAIEEYKDTFARFPETAGVYLPNGEALQAGSRLRLPELAETLRRYSERGPEGITEGAVADAVLLASRAHGGVLTSADLASYRPVWREPLRFQAFGWSFASMPLPSSGGIIVAQSLLMLESLHYAALPRGGADRDHLLAETWRRAFADRFLLGDPDHTLARAADLLSPDWIARRAAGVDAARATPSAGVRPWPGDAAGLAGRPAATTHLSAADGSGMVVSMTTTLNEWFGCGLFVPGAGFFLNDEMDDFVTAPGRPNLYGLVQGDANAVRPGARMLSSMSPVVAWRNGEAIAAGSRGGSRIPTVTTQILLNLIVDGDPLQAAVDRPRLHHQWLPDEILAESDAFTSDMEAELRRRGHTLRITRGLGEAAAVRVLADGRLEAAADTRRNPGGAEVLNGTAGRARRDPGRPSPARRVSPGPARPARGQYWIRLTTSRPGSRARPSRKASSTRNPHPTGTP